MRKKNLVFMVLVFFICLFLASCNTPEYIQTPEDAINTVYTLSVISAVALAYFKFK